MAPLIRFRWTLVGHRGRQQVHRDVRRHQPPRGRAAGWNPVTDQTQAVFHGEGPAQEGVREPGRGRGQAARGQVPGVRRVQGQRNSQEDSEESVLQIQVMRQPPCSLRQKFQLQVVCNSNVHDVQTNQN
ncbi:hypothetical protein CDAR_184191 [Caerostris darwini]|uniref:Uncharacterized protein n=1 Tax=Caerostris darwini TaxID=1538125 RepID=A0AAV4VXR8_9ARAC|nr:hypothetical protein CDAR_184191 [Caerostris darwini]